MITDGALVREFGVFLKALSIRRRVHQSNASISMADFLDPDVDDATVTKDPKRTVW